MKHTLLALALAAAQAVALPAHADNSLPRLERRDGRHALLVGGEPFLMLGVQANNSSNYPPALRPPRQRLDDLGEASLLTSNVGRGERR